MWYFDFLLQVCGKPWMKNIPNARGLGIPAAIRLVPVMQVNGGLYGTLFVRL